MNTAHSARTAAAHRVFATAQPVSAHFSAGFVATAAAALCLGLSLAPSPAQADDPGDFVALNVRFADLDLGRSLDAATLYRRIENAARKVCSAQPVAFHAVNVAECTRRAVSQAVKAIDNPMLTNQHLVRSHAPESRARVAAE